MCGRARLPPASNIFKQIYNGKRPWVATSILKKQESPGIGVEGQKTTYDKVDPIVAFSKPPSFPPILGPLVAYSLFDTLSSWDNNDDH
ncbi:hypothetical protein U1Q18_021218 [Sarracenia purpurea var. burkii]